MTWCRTEDHGILPFRIKVIFYLFSEWLRLKHVSDCAMADQVLSASMSGEPLWVGVPML